MQLTPSSLDEVLSAAGSQNSALERKSGEHQLKLWENVPHFYRLLQDIYLNVDSPLQNRWIAVICFKNGITKFWRKNAKGAIPIEEKNLIRSRLFDMVSESNRQINSQNALSISKICKIDFPTEWPHMFIDLASRLQNAQIARSYVELYNLLNILNQVVKMLSISRFGRPRAALQQNATSLMNISAHNYSTLTVEWMTDNDLAKMEIGYLSLKVCSRLLCEGYESPHRSPDARAFYVETRRHLEGFISIYDSSPSEILAKHIRLIGKMNLNFIDRHKMTFMLMPELQQVLKIYLTVIVSKAPTPNYEEESDEDAYEFWELIILQGFNLLRKIIGLIFKNGVSIIRHGRESDMDETRHAIGMLKSELFSNDIILKLTDKILLQYLRLSSSDITSWRNEPEEWVAAEMQANWEFHSRPCAEKVFEDLLVNFKAVLADNVLHFISHASASNDTMLKDSAFAACSLCSTSLFDKIDFDQILPEVLIPNGYANDSGNCLIIRRRISMVISDWISVKCSSENRVKIYQLLLFFLSKSDPYNDLVVQLYAIQALRYVVDSWEFRVEDFLPYFKDFLDAIFALVNTGVQLIESKLMLLQVVAVVVERTEARVVPFSDLILQFLPTLWDDSDENYLMKGTIIQLLTSLVVANGEKSSNCCKLAIPVLRVCIDINNPIHAYLFEDALPLWHAVVQNSSDPNNEIISLLSFLPNLLQSSTETISAELDILESYLLLDADYTVHNFSASVFQTFANYISHMTVDSLSSLVSTMELLSLTCSVQMYGQALIDSTLFAHLIAYVRDEGKSSVITSKIFCVLSRISLSNTEIFWQLVLHTPSPPSIAIPKAAGLGTNHRITQSENRNITTDQESPSEATPLIDSLLEVWIAQFEYMSSPRDRKLNCLALTSLLRTGHQELMVKLHDIINIWCECVDEVSETSHGDLDVYYEPNISASSPSFTTNGVRESPETLRRMNLRQIDPIHTIALRPFIKSTLENLQQLSTEHSNYLSSLDPSLIALLSSVLN